MTAYYNEFDPKAAAWLRELIKEGHIADGVVDERSITDVKAHELTGFNQHHFFAGIGGWSLALRLADIGDDEEWCTASCPCQPFSAAGKQMGNDDPRHLFPALRKLIARFNPARVVGEQVASKSGREWLARVRLEMAALGYGVGAADLCSAGVGSPNIRQRLYWMAHANGDMRGAGRGCKARSAGFTSIESARRGVALGLADSDGGNTSEERQQRGGQHGQLAQNGGVGGMGNTMRSRSLSGTHAGVYCGEESAGSRDGELERSDAACGLGDANQQGPQGRHERGHGGDERIVGATGLAGAGLLATAGNYLAGQGGTDGLEHAKSDGRQQWGAKSGGGSIASRRGSGFWDSFDLLPCTDGKARRIEPGSFPLAHGIPNRVGKLRGYGNAINPYVAAAFLQACKKNDRGSLVTEDWS